MNTHDSAFAYRQSTALGASPVGQVIALYDTMLRDLHRASDSLATSQVEQRVAAVNHALLVIGELQGVLDFERGGDPARNLDTFYKVARNLILQASMKGSAETFRDVISMVMRIRAAWAQIEQLAETAGTAARAGVSTAERQRAVLRHNPVPTEEPESSARSNWRA
jgi:flagellar secretion chaperone FliS